MAVSKTWSGTSLEAALGLVEQQHSLHSNATMDDEAIQRELDVSLVPCFLCHHVGIPSKSFDWPGSGWNKVTRCIFSTILKRCTNYFVDKPLMEKSRKVLNCQNNISGTLSGWLGMLDVFWYCRICPSTIVMWLTLYVSLLNSWCRIWFPWILLITKDLELWVKSHPEVVEVEDSDRPIATPARTEQSVPTQLPENPTREEVRNFLHLHQDAQPRTPMTSPASTHQDPLSVRGTETTKPDNRDEETISRGGGKVNPDRIPGGKLADEVPDINDLEAPRFYPGQHQLSDNAIKLRAKRIFTPRIDGSMKVSQTIFNEWKSRGKERQSLEQIFKQVGYDADPCLCFCSFSPTHFSSW